MKFNYSEEKMADSFQDVLKSKDGLPFLGHFDAVYREVACRQGKPDFIAIKNRLETTEVSYPDLPGIVAPSILNLLKPVAPRTLDFILANTEFSRAIVIRCLQSLLHSKIIEQTEFGSYRLGRMALGKFTELWTFELKLENAKRAIFQAQQSRAFADYSIIIIPPGQEYKYNKFEDTMQRWGIGLGIFDPLTKEFSIVKKVKKSKPLVQTHRIYALSKLQFA